MRNRRHRSVTTVFVVAAMFAASMLLPASGPAAAESPEKPYSVYVARPDEVDAQLDARLGNAARALEARLGEHPARFRLADSKDAANIRVTIFDAQAVSGEVQYVGLGGFAANRFFDARGRDQFSFEAVVRVDGKRKLLDGSGSGATEEASVRDAAADFVRKLARFTEESYTAAR